MLKLNINLGQEKSLQKIKQGCFLVIGIRYRDKENDGNIQETYSGLGKGTETKRKFNINIKP